MNQPLTGHVPPECVSRKPITTPPTDTNLDTDTTCPSDYQPVNTCDVEAVQPDDLYTVPEDPMEALQCDSCQ